MQASLAPSELGGVAKGLRRAAPSLARLETEQTPLYKQTDLFNKCLTKVIYPAGNTKIQDGSGTSGVEDYKEFWYSLVGLAGHRAELRRQRRVRQVPRRQQRADAESRRPTAIARHETDREARLLGRSPLTPLGTRPAFPAEEPPLPAARALLQAGAAELQRPALAGPGGRERLMADRRHVRTRAQPPELDEGHEGGLSVRDQIERYRSAFIAVVTMIVIAAAVGGYILAHENLKLPGWVPVLGRNYYTLKADFQTAQAVTPGPGPGGHDRRRKIGEIASVDLQQRRRRR